VPQLREPHRVDGLYRAVSNCSTRYRVAVTHIPEGGSVQAASVVESPLSGAGAPGLDTGMVRVSAMRLRA
jgi:hypothetical protein